MLLIEIASDRLALINATLSHMGASNRLVYADSDEVLDEAIRLVEWAQTVPYIDDFRAGMDALLSSKGIKGIRDALQLMVPSGFTNHPYLRLFYLAVKEIDHAHPETTEAVMDLKPEVIAFTRNVKQTLHTLINLNDIALGNVNFDLGNDTEQDPLMIALASALLKQLGLSPKPIHL